MYGSKNILFMLLLFKKQKSQIFKIFLSWFKKSANLSKNYDIWSKMLSSFDAGPSEVSVCTIWLRLNKK